MTEQEMRVKAKALLDETLETLRWLQENDPEAPEGLADLLSELVKGVRGAWDLEDLSVNLSFSGLPRWKALSPPQRLAAIKYLCRDDVGIMDGGRNPEGTSIHALFGPASKLKKILEGKPKHRDPHGLIVKWSEDCADHPIEVWREYLLDNGWEEGHREPGVHRFLKENEWGLYPHCIDIPDPSFADYKRHIVDAVVMLCNTEDTTPYKLNIDLIRTVEKLRRLEEKGDPEECERSPTSWLGHSWGEQHLRKPKYMNAENPPAFACVFCGKEKEEKTQDRTAQSAEGAASQM